MKTLITKIALLLITAATHLAGAAQDRPAKPEFLQKYVQVGDSYMDTSKRTPQQLAHYHKQVRLNKLKQEHYYFNWLGKQNIGVRFDNKAKSTIYEGLRHNSNGQYYPSILIDGTSSVEIIMQNLDDEVKGFNYLYRVIKNNNQELVGWTPPMQYKTSADGKIMFAYLGKFNYSPGQFIKVEIYNVKNFAEQDEILIDWRKVEAANVRANINYISPHTPMPDNYMLSHNFNELHRDSDRHVYYENKKIVFRNVPYKDMMETREVGDTKFHLSDTLQYLSFDINNGQRPYNYKITLQREIDGKTDSLQLGETNNRYELYKEFWKNPGVYHITFTPKIQAPGGRPVKVLSNLKTTVKFTVLPPLTSSYTVPLKTLAYIILIVLSTAGFMFMMYRDQQKKKLMREAQNRQISTLQLQSVRSQLNPHFIFNALAGIQNLMNKNAIEDANRYLSKFARLTRNVLDDSDKELVTIEHETDLLNDYLQMEQMRFGFKFKLEVDSSEIDQQIEIPGMLLQPFIENAVKHGVSALKEGGLITVAIRKKDTSLLLTVQDNGPGFSNTPGNGMGIKLCEDRIKLLNQIYKNTKIVMSKTSGNNGTLITIELQNWL